MQNIDFYERKNIRALPPQFSTVDPEYFPRMTQDTPREMERVRKKASRIFFLITSLCIISFTAGIVIGIKFVGGSNRQIVDQKTFNAMTGVKNNFPGLINDKPSETTSPDNVFPKNTYPYAIKLNNVHDYEMSQKIATFLSHKGHTVILTKNGSKYRIYIGPYKIVSDAQDSLKKILTYQKYSLAENCKIIKR